MRALLIGVGIAVGLVIAAKGFGEKAGSIAVLQPAESGVMRSAFGSRLKGIGGPVYAVAPSPWPSPGERGNLAVYVGTRKGLFRSGDDGVIWERVFSPGIFGGVVRAIASGDFLYIGAGKLLYRSDLQSGKRRRLFKTAHPILSIAVDPSEPGRVLVGTGQGLHANPGLPDGPVYAIRFHPVRSQEVYAVTDAGLFLSGDRGGVWRRVWVGRQTEVEALEEGSPFDELRANGSGSGGFSDEEGPIRPRALAIDPKTGIFYLADERRVFVSADDGKSWAPLQADVPPGPIDAIAVASGKHLWVGTAHGLFRIPLPAPIPSPSPFSSPPSGGEGRGEGVPVEPTIQEVHQVAIRYAEVMPEKIGNWRRLAVVRNFIPRMTVSLDRDRDQTIASSTSSGKTTFTVGPEDESVSLDFGFTWDLANLVWNPDQTTIDTRSRLMVQLRADVLEEVTRVYFERKRLLAEFGGNPTDDSILEQERVLRIEELAARIDALTGGWFSRRMSDQKWKEPFKYENIY